MQERLFNMYIRGSEDKNKIELSMQEVDSWEKHYMVRVETTADLDGKVCVSNHQTLLPSPTAECKRYLISIFVLVFFRFYKAHVHLYYV